MTYHRLAYDDAATTSEMASDAREAGRALRLPEQVDASVPGAAGLDTPLPGSLVVSDDLAQMAAGLELHFD